MADILVAILDEADTVPLDLLEVILAQFLQKDPVRPGKVGEFIV